MDIKNLDLLLSERIKGPTLVRVYKILTGQTLKGTQLGLGINYNV